MVSSTKLIGDGINWKDVFMSQHEDPNDVRQATKKGHTRTILIVSMIAVVVLIGAAYMMLSGQDTDEAVDGVVVDPESEAVTTDENANNQ